MENKLLCLSYIFVVLLNKQLFHHFNFVFSGILDIVCYKSFMYIFYRNADVCKLELLSIQKCVSLLVSNQCWNISAELCSRFGNTFVKSRHALHLKTIQETFSHLEFSEHADLYSTLERILLDRHIEDASESESEASDTSSLRDRSETSSIDTWNSGLDHRSIISADDSSTSGFVIEFDEMEKMSSDKESNLNEKYSEDLIKKNSNINSLQKAIVSDGELNGDGSESVDNIETDYKKDEPLFSDCVNTISDLVTNEVSISPLHKSENNTKNMGLDSIFSPGQAEGGEGDVMESVKSTFKLVVQDANLIMEDNGMSKESESDWQIENSVASQTGNINGKLKTMAQW